MNNSARVLALCTGIVKPILIRNAGRPNDIDRTMSAIHKSVVSHAEDPQAIACLRLGLAGDEQADLSVHGGLDKAIYCYPFEHYDFWKAAFAWLTELPMLYGQVGENLSIAGLREDDVYVGDQLRIGEAVLLRITTPREPCYKFNAKMRSPLAAKLMAQEGRCGWYASVMQEGKIKAGDPITVIPGPRDITVAEQYQYLMKR